MGERVIDVVIGQPAPAGVENLPLGEDVMLVVEDVEYQGVLSAKWCDYEGNVVRVSFSEKSEPGEWVKPSVWTVDIAMEFRPQEPQSEPPEPPRVVP